MNQQSYVNPDWRFDELIDALRPYRVIAERLQSKGYPLLPLSSIAGWRMRNSIPSVWVLPMVQLGLEARIIKSVNDLRVDQPPLENYRNVGSELSHQGFN
jgi:hypothetical protein